MGIEIERKFLVINNLWHDYNNDCNIDKKVKYKQGYLSSNKKRVVRIRTIKNSGFITVKSLTVGAVKYEYEYEIPFFDANEMLNKLCQRPLIEKYRYKIPFAGLIWEVDEFLGENNGLIIAEVELQSETQLFDIPVWAGKEVTYEAAYFNSNLVLKPFCTWSNLPIAHELL